MRDRVRVGGTYIQRRRETPLLDQSSPERI